ncbi:hypothetical protein GGR58DRAFT_151418 [Xylaria digitata]|nr:hypothetical protein GGR58DRAFT_151418 [Xylaria digitata]
MSIPVEYLTLPTVEDIRGPRRYRRAPKPYAYNLLGLIKYYTGTDPDLIWGPFYKRYRAVQHERKETWIPYDLNYIWDRIPNTTQKRPGVVERFFNRLVGRDPPPTLNALVERTDDDDYDDGKKEKKKKTTSKYKTTAKPKTDTVIDNWKDAIKNKSDLSPTRIDFTEWYGRYKHPMDYSDEFYRTNYETLYNRICDFADTWFGAGVWLEDFRDEEHGEFSAWEVPQTEQFTQYARSVAHEDRGYVEWNDILSDPKHRKWLCVGIFAQIIERKIFNQLLFGASKEYQDELERHDAHWVLQEGFNRKDGRRGIVRSALGEGLLPEYFWDAVDDLAGQTVLIFQPLLALLSLHNSLGGGKNQPAFWQEVHSILAMAGYLHICMAISPSIFHILSASPGARFQWDEESHADQKIYTHSKNFHKSHEERWRVLAEVTSKGASVDVTKLLESFKGSEDVSEYMPFPQTQEEYRVMDHQRRRGGKVMYAVFPKLTRYTAENVGDLIMDVKPYRSHESENAGEGMRISIISRCMVVYYQGLVHADGEDGIPLDEHLKEISWNRSPGSIFPYRQHYWNDDGYPATGLHWPVYPDWLDTYWIWAGGWYIISWILWVWMGPESSESVGLLNAYVYKPLIWFAWEVTIRLLMKLSGLQFFDGPWAWVRLQAIGVLFYNISIYLYRHDSVPGSLFALLAPPLGFLDSVLIDKWPRAIMGFSGFLRESGWRGVFSGLSTAVNTDVTDVTDIVLQ